MFNAPYNLDDEKFDLELFKTLGEIITQLVLVKPEKRMKLQDARKKLNELDKFAETKVIKFFLLSPFFQSQDNPDVRDETTQNNMGLMNDLTSSRLFTSSTIGDEKKLTQRDTNLCVSFSAMRLLSYALVEFLEKHFTCDSDVLTNLKDKILKYPANSGSSKTTPDNRDGRDNPDNPDNREKETHFIHKLISICCGVISPRSLNGLNHCYLDDDFQTAAQEQHIRKLFHNKFILI